jgi:hypothetical protein
MTEDELSALSDELYEHIKSKIPDGYGFVLLAFDRVVDGDCAIRTDSKPEDVAGLLESMAEFLVNDDGKVAEEERPWN